MKINHEKERDCLIRKIRGLSVDELATFCLDKTRTKLTQHPNAAVKEFSLSFEPSQVYFMASSLQLTFTKVCHEIDTVNTFGRPPLTPHMLSTFTVISDETRKYFAIRVCTGYYRVGHSPLFYIMNS